MKKIFIHADDPSSNDFRGERVRGMVTDSENFRHGNSYRRVVCGLIAILWVAMTVWTPTVAQETKSWKIVPKRTDLLVWDATSSANEPGRVFFQAEGVTEASEMTAEIRDYRDAVVPISVTIQSNVAAALDTPAKPVAAAGVETEVAAKPASFVAVIDPALRSRCGFYDLVIRRAAVESGTNTELGAEATLPESRIGLIVLGVAGTSPVIETTGNPDPYLCIDGAISWLVSDPVLREEMIVLAKKSGIAMIRERFSSSDIFPTAASLTDSEEPNWKSSGRQYDMLRQTYEKHGMPILEMGHDTPAWTERVGKYPKDLNASSQMWAKIAARWCGCWGGFELWNEPDIMFSGDMPADQYAAWAKAVSVNFPHEIRPQVAGSTRLDGGNEVPLIAGVTAHFNSDWMETLGRNGLLDQVDIYSFHTYATAMQMERIAGEHRDWLAHWNHGSMPLWLTECGRPWKKGPDRAPVSEDQNSSLDIAMKAVEAYACGVERYFAFVLPYYEENDNNFGMLDRDGGPLRCFAGYAFAGKMLGHMEYMGDLKLPAGVAATDDQPAPEGTAKLLRARVFRNVEASDAGESSSMLHVALYTGQNDPTAEVELGASFANLELHAYGIDGRLFEVKSTGESCRVPVPDGLTWLTVSGVSSDAMVDAETEAMRLWRAASHSDMQPAQASDASQRSVVPAEKSFHPMVLRYDFDESVVGVSPSGYRIKDDSLETLPIAVTLSYIASSRHGIPSESQSVTLEISSPDGPMEQSDLAEQKVSVACGGTATASWSLDVKKLFGNDSTRWLRVSVKGGTSDEFVEFRISRRPQLEQVLAKSEKSRRLPIDELNRWRMVNGGKDGSLERLESVSGFTYMDNASKEPVGVKMTSKFAGGDRWCYPQFTLPDDVRMEDYTGIVLRLRTATPGDVRVFLWEAENVGWINGSTIYDADGKIQTVYVRFSELGVSSANSPDKNGKLDLGRVRTISVGMNPKADDMSLELFDVYLVK
ncbi:MAG: hypothetical protein PHE53_07300 [Thermoguttaceae bacterium]|nr:hypothetical protein [Thermoguttaceae bacterium]